MALHPLDYSRAEWLHSLNRQPDPICEIHHAAEVLLGALPELPAVQPEIAPVLPSKFGVGSSVWHVKTATKYHIVGTPDMFVLELTREPAYAYLLKDGRVCIRCQSEFEDGRFVSEYDWQRLHAGNSGVVQ